ncbi:MAG: hypothetical protein AB1801_00840 [Chloroflexota bacterium]
MAPTKNNLDSNLLAPALIRQLFIWAPIVIGVVHQILMLVFGIETIYVFVDPPGYIGPMVTLEWQWWLVLLLGSAAVCISSYLGRLQNVVGRLAFPLYIYILFLLIFIKPV